MRNITAHMLLINVIERGVKMRDISQLGGAGFNSNQPYFLMSLPPFTSDEALLPLHEQLDVVEIADVLEAASTSTLDSSTDAAALQANPSSGSLKMASSS